MAAINSVRLHLYDPSTGWQGPLSPPLTEEQIYRWFAYPSALVVDRNNDVWIGAVELGFGYAGQDGGVFRYSTRTREWTVFDEETGGLPQVVALGLAVSPQLGEVWVVNWGGALAAYRQGGWKILGERQARFWRLALSPAAEAWMTTLEPCGHENVCPAPVVRYKPPDWETFTPQNSGLTDHTCHGLGGVLEVGFDASGAYGWAPRQGCKGWGAGEKCSPILPATAVG